MTMNFYFGREFYPYEKRFAYVCKWLQKKGLVNPKKIRIKSEAFRWMVDKIFKEIKEGEKEK